MCLKEKSARGASCKGRMATKEDIKIRAVDHDCVPDETGVEAKKPFEAMKRAREDNDTPIRQVFQQEFEPLQNKRYEFVNHLPQFSNLKRTLDDSRNQSQGLQSEPKQPKDVLLDDDSLKMADSKIFLLADSGETDRILSFVGRKGLEAIKTTSVFSWIVPLRAVAASLNKSIQSMLTWEARKQKQMSFGTGCVSKRRCLLSYKTKKETYIHMFQMILRQVSGWNPEFVNIDFESSAIESLK